MAKLTVKQLEALTEKDAGRRLSDGGSLYGIVKTRSDGMSVLFRWRYRFAGKLQDYTCGSWPKDSLAGIRATQDKARRILDGGKGPAEEKRIDQLKSQADQAEAVGKEQSRITEAEARKARLTVLDLFERWERLGLQRRKDKGAEARRSFEKDVLPAIGNIAAEDVTRSMVVNILDGAVERGARIVARNLLGDIRQMFGFAIVRGLVEHDPTSRLKRDDFGKKKERERVLNETEIKALPGKLASARMAKQNVAAIWIMLSTCCRVGEISRARWEDVDLDAGTWRIPPENAKNAKEHKVSLSPLAVKHFDVLRGLAGESPWALPARYTGQHVGLKSLAKQIGDRQRGDKPSMKCRSLNINALALPGGKWMPHDLRRTGATMMGVLGVRPDVIEKCLNHVQQNRLVRIYQRQKLEAEQAEAWRLLGERLVLLLNDDAENVVTFRRGVA